jgi:hypothetical protein
MVKNIRDARYEAFGDKDSVFSLSICYKRLEFLFLNAKLVYAT